MVFVLRRFDLQPNIRERNPVEKRDPTVHMFAVKLLQIKHLID